MNLTHCKVCGQPIDRLRNKRLRSYCSVACRNRFHSQKMIASGQSQKRQQLYAERKATEASDMKKKCALCGLWFRRVAFHVFQRHQMTAYEYKQYLQIRTSRGILADESRKHLHDLALEYKMDEQLKHAGKATRFVKGGTKQKAKKPNAGKRFTSDEYS